MRFSRTFSKEIKYDKIIMHGCNGKMGQVISALVENDTDCTITAGVDPYVNKSNPYPVFSKIADCDIKSDVIIDFSTSTAVKPLLEYALEKQLPIVVCTTGLSEEILDLIRKAASKIPVFFSANMSLGINLLINLVKRASEVLFDANFDIEIIEKHHSQKLMLQVELL